MLSSSLKHEKKIENNELVIFLAVEYIFKVKIL